jgi:hypothetical protein
VTKQQLFSMVKEIKETTSIDEVNSLIEKGWILLHIVSCPVPIYSMGRTEE